MDKVDLRGWDLIGTVGVDSGQMMLCDPCYLGSSWDSEDGDFASDAMGREKPDHSNFSYAGACNVTLAKGQAGVIGNGLGAVCSSGFGDGSYGVYVKHSNEGEWGDRIGAMMIVFIGEDEDEESCEDCGGELYGFNNGSQCPDCEAAEEADDEDEDGDE